MALLERVGTLLRANLNDLIDKAEDPEKLLKQLVLDMENQLMQVKTQVAILWTSLRGTDIADEARVVANHRLAVGVEAALTDMLKAMEDTVRLRQYMVTEPQVIDDSTKSLYQ